MVNYIAALVDIRRDLESVLQRVNTALGEMGEAVRSSPRTPLSVTYTFPPDLDYRQNPEGLRRALMEVYDRVIWVSQNPTGFTDRQCLHDEVCRLAAKTRLLQVQSEEGSREWETAVGVIRILTRIASETKAGYVYGLAVSHNTDWGQLYLSLQPKE